MTKNLLLAGVGGQGILLISRILTTGLVEQGYDVKVSEIHGMSQRGGAVTSQIRWSDQRVMSPVIENGRADIIVALEEMEALRNIAYLKPDGKLIVSSERKASMTVLTGEEMYAEDISDVLKKAVKDTTLIDAPGLAEKLGERRASNFILLGFLIGCVGLTQIDWQDILSHQVKAAFQAVNLRALQMGMEQSRA